MIFLAVIALAAVVTWLASLGVLRVALRLGIHPPVRDRDMHTKPVPRIGGLAMYIGMLGAFAFAATQPQFAAVFADPVRIWALLGAVTLIVVVGVLDDLFDLDWMIKLSAQILTAAMVAWFSVQLVSLPIAGITVGSSTWSFGLTVVLIVSAMNAVNFIDGLDGLVAGTTIIGSSAFFVYILVLSEGLGQTNAYFSLASLITAAVIGVCLGFLTVNWHPAKMFMGDSGALMVGLLTASSAIAVTGQIDIAQVGGRSQILPAFIPILLPVAILTLPLLDAALAVVRRLLNGQSPFAADRKHLHHRLVDMGHSHLGAVLVFYAWTAIVSVGTLLFLNLPWPVALAIIVVGFIVCAIVTAAPVMNRISHSAVHLFASRRRELQGKRRQRNRLHQRK